MVNFSQRVEWSYLDGYLQLTASGTDSVNVMNMLTNIKLVSEQNAEELDQKLKYGMIEYMISPFRTKRTEY